MTQPSAAGASMRILLVDDHAIVREGLQRILESTPERWVALQAESGFEALQVLRTRSVDLAIIDLSMPGMPGLDLLRRLKGEFPSLRVLVLSMHDFLRKFTLTTLQEIEARHGQYATLPEMIPV